MKLIQTIVNIREDEDEETNLFLSEGLVPIPVEGDIVDTARGDRRIMQRYFVYQHVGPSELELIITLFVQPAAL